MSAPDTGYHAPIDIDVPASLAEARERRARRARPHYFPDDTPEPVAQPYGAIDALLRPVLQLARALIFILMAGAALGYGAFFFLYR